MTSPRQSDSERKLIDWVIAGLGVVLAVLLFFLFRQSEILRREIIAQDRAMRINASPQGRGAAATESTATIQPWMTFSYLDHVFGLPPDYLKTAFSISDPRYPQLTIGEFSEDNHRSATSTLSDIQAAVRNYLTGSPATTSSF